MIPSPSPIPSPTLPVFAILGLLLCEDLIASLLLNPCGSTPKALRPVFLLYVLFSHSFLVGWHGTPDLDTCWKIAESNFHDPHERTETTDQGWFGSGTYFTQYPSYGAMYALQHTLLFSWVLMGRAYPVTQSPSSKDSLVGKSCVEGYNSHYVLVRGHGLNKVPAPHDPEYDEIVVFSKNQILPRCIFHYSIRPGSLKTGVPIPLALRDASVVVLWVSETEDFEMNEKLKSRYGDQIHVVVVSSTFELILWIKDYQKQGISSHPLSSSILSPILVLKNSFLSCYLPPALRHEGDFFVFPSWRSFSPFAIRFLGAGSNRLFVFLGHINKIKIITPLVRNTDGGEKAAEKLIQAVHSDHPFHEIPIGVYSEDSGHLQPLSKKYVWPLIGEEQILSFCEPHKPLKKVWRRSAQGFLR